MNGKSFAASLKPGSVFYFEEIELRNAELNSTYCMQSYGFDKCRDAKNIKQIYDESHNRLIVKRKKANVLHKNVFLFLHNTYNTSMPSFNI
jgi:hypothetical protein